MKFRTLKPGKTGPDFSYPVRLENDSVYVQIEHEGKSYTFNLRQQDDALIVLASDAPLGVFPIGGNSIMVRGPEDRPGKYGKEEL